MQTEEQYIVRSFNTAAPKQYAISGAMSKKEAEELARKFMRGNLYNKATVERYTGQKPGQY
jgi:hypothetical protein